MKSEAEGKIVPRKGAVIPTGRRITMEADMLVRVRIPVTGATPATSDARTDNAILGAFVGMLEFNHSQET